MNYAANTPDPRALYWRWINLGKYARPQPKVVSIPVVPGTRLRATDRVYEVQLNGSYRRITAKGLKVVPFKDSNLAVRPPELSRPDKWKSS